MVDLLRSGEQGDVLDKCERDVTVVDPKPAVLFATGLRNKDLLRIMIGEVFDDMGVGEEVAVSNRERPFPPAPAP